MEAPSVLAERLLRPTEVAEMLGVTTGTLKVWRHRGDDFGPRYKRFPGERGEIRYLLSEVEVADVSKSVGFRRMRETHQPLKS
jgi:hypothetical protein